MEKIIETNQVTIVGKINSGFEFSHEVFGETFYSVNLLVERLSESHDIIPITISERLIDVNKDYSGEYVKISGQFRSYNKRISETRAKLILSVFAREVEFVEEMPEDYNSNNITLDGYVCKQPIYRKTPLGREITDILLAVNRPYGKSDYIPCLCWGRDAKFASTFNVGEHVTITGRIQSRDYYKKIDEEQYEKRTAYEVSVWTISIVEGDK